MKFNAIFYDIKLPNESISRPIAQADEQTQQQYIQIKEPECKVVLKN